jgi:hypothetical protein
MVLPEARVLVSAHRPSAEQVEEIFTGHVPGVQRVLDRPLSASRYDRILLTRMLATGSDLLVSATLRTCSRSLMTPQSLGSFSCR